VIENEEKDKTWLTLGNINANLIPTTE